MALNTNDLTVTSLETITAFEPTTGDFLWVLDELQDVTIANAEEQTDITGKQGRLLNTLKRNKTVTISGNNGLISGGMMGTQVGGEFEQSENATIMWTEYATATGTSIDIQYTPSGQAGSEIMGVYVKNDDNTLGAALTQGTSATGTNFSYSNKKITLPTAYSGKPVVIYYMRTVAGDVLENVSDHYSKKATLYIDAIAEDRCAKSYRVQFYVPLADFNGNFEITMGGDQAAHAFEARALASACASADGSVSLWTYTVFGAEE